MHCIKEPKLRQKFKTCTVKSAQMDHLSPNWTAHITPYLTLILINMAFKWWNKPWLSIWRPYVSVSKLNKGQYRRSNLATGGPSERTLRYITLNVATAYLSNLHIDTKEDQNWQETKLNYWMISFKNHFLPHVWFKYIFLTKSIMSSCCHLR